MQKKQVLYIGSPFFNYYKQIIAEFELQGYSVDYYNDRPSESSLVKGLIKIKKSIMGFIIQKYFDRIMSEIKYKSYDLVFIVNCKVFTPYMIQQLKNSQKSARFVLYMWDSLTLYPNSKELISLFDTAYSFDTEDCEKINGLFFLPLFYCKEYEKIGRDNSLVSKEFDIVSVCTAHPNRYKIIRELFPMLEAQDMRVFSYMFLNRMQYWYNKVFVEEFKNAKSSEFNFIPIPEMVNQDLLKKSIAVFDIPHNKQSGLTMRTIETLGAKRKLITSNSNIRRYDFYNKNNIFILNKDNWVEIKAFINSDYDLIDNNIFRKYTLQNWITTILSEKSIKYLNC